MAIDAPAANPRHHLNAYLAGRGSLHAVTEAVVTAIWSRSPDDEAAATAAVYAIQLALAELSHRLLTKNEFRDAMRALQASGVERQPA